MQELQALLASKGFTLSLAMKQQLLNKAKVSGIWFKAFSVSI